MGCCFYGTLTILANLGLAYAFKDYRTGGQLFVFCRAKHSSTHSVAKKPNHVSDLILC